MNSLDDFAELISDQIGIPVTSEDLRRSVDQVPGWDSLHVMWLLTLLERETGRRLSLPQVIEAPTLAHVYDLAVAP
ncbi:phosphopantetheine-binding protein [Streptomyces sp. NPDC002088]|uniref:acyl carrier protein n=1 Tax=unclassified Streptomyces TaxID=2593676 RepID=UPI00331D4BC0